MPPNFSGGAPDPMLSAASGASAAVPGAGSYGGLDVLTQNTGEAARRVHARDLAVQIVTAVFRLVKLATLHSIDNQAMVRQVDETVTLVNDYGQRAERNVSILFAHGSVFVGGQLLRANRTVYEGALELGEILKKVGAVEIGIMRDVRAQDLYDLAGVLAEALRSPKPKRVERPSPRIRLRGINAAALGREGLVDQRLDPAAQVARTYASAIVIMRRFFEELRRGRYDLSQRVKRVAQRLVDLSSGETPAFLGVTAARNANHDQAGRAVNTAILSLSMARQVTTDAVLLARIAMAALLYDAARARIAGVAGPNGPVLIPQLSEQQENESPAGTAAVLTALGRVNEPSVMRTVMTYEAHWVQRRAGLGPLYRGLRQASLQARIIAVARAFNDMLTPAPGATPTSADEAIAKLELGATEPADRTALRLLVGALGVFPTGTLVELSTGEVAVVVQTPANPALYSQPRVRVVLDERGGAVARPIEIDLAQQRRRSGEPSRNIQRVVATSDDASAASLRALASGPVASHETSSPGMIASGIRTQGGATSAPPASIAAISAPVNSRSATLASQFTRRDSAPPSARLVDIQVQSAAQGEQGFDGSRGSSASTLAVTREEQARLLDAEHVRLEKDAVDSFTDEADVKDSKPSAEPTAEGTLAKTPFVHLLIYMLDQRLTGTTVFHAPSGVTHSVFFHEGAPAKARTGAMVAPLDRVLLELGLLDEATLRASLVEVSKRKILHGRSLVMKGLLGRDDVLSALRLQVLRKLTYLCDLPPETRYAYYEGENLLAAYGGPELTPCEPLAAIMAGVRLRADDPMVDATLLRIAARPLALHAESDPKRFMLQRDERAVVDMIRARSTTLDDLFHAGVAQERVVRLTVYALVLTRHLDLGSGRDPVGIHRDWSAVGSLDASSASPEPLPAAPPRALAATVTPPQRAAATRSTSTEPKVRSAVTPPRPPQVEAPAQVRITRTEPNQVLSRPTTRLARVGPSGAPPSTRGAASDSSQSTFGVDADVPPNSAPPGSSAGGATGWRPTGSAERFDLDRPPASRPTTKMPRMTPGESIDVETPAPTSHSAPPSRRGPPPSSRDVYGRPIGRGGVTPPPVSASAPLPTLGSTPPPPGRGGAPSLTPTPSPTLAGPPVDVAARRIEIEQRARSIDGDDYFQMLGVTRDATPEQIRSAYFALARVWHPDRLPGELADLRVPIGRIFARVNEAYQTLSDAGRHAEYIEKLERRGGASDAADDEKLARIVDAALEFQKAEILVRKHDLVGAEALATRAVEADPEQPEYRTLLTWIKALRRGDPPGTPEGAQSGHFDDLIQILDAVIEKEPQYERAIYYRGVLLKRAGRHDKAMRDFKLVAELNPKNLDAVREVRLHEMRRRTNPTGTQPPEGSGGGLFNKFFKR
jgi:curved DNA-binding protein CbpA